MYLVFIITLLFATPAIAQDIPQDAIDKRLQILEQEKVKLEEVYKEITIRVDELKQLIAPKTDEPKEVK